MRKLLMIPKPVRYWLLTLLLLCSAIPAHAAITCSLSSSGWTIGYSTTATLNTTGAASTTISCSRLSTDPATQAYSLQANNGLAPTGGTNQAALAAAKVKYNEFQDAAITILWGPTPPAKNAFAGTINFGTGLTASVPLTYYFSITALQAVAAGNYTDTVTETLTYGAATATATHPVLIIVNPVCTIATAPGAVAFTYTSFQAATATGSTTFAVNCTNLTPYTAGLDLYAVTDAAVNLAYTLNVGQTTRPAGSVYTAGAALSATGSGANQTISIDGSMAAGQAGTCAAASCTNAASANRTRTLTITY